LQQDDIGALLVFKDIKTGDTLSCRKGIPIVLESNEFS